MTDNDSTRFVSDKSEYDRTRGTGERVAYTAALHLPNAVKGMCQELRELAASANQVNVLNPFSSYARLRSIRKTYVAREPAFRAQLQDCFVKLAEPVEGTSTLELGWLQGITLATGLSGLLELNSSMSAVSEALDRKSAYSIACFSLYVSIVSLLLTLPFDKLIPKWLAP